MNLILTKLNQYTRSKYQHLILAIVIGFSVSACQLTGETPASNGVVANTINYGQYYLALKNLSESELQKEIAQQRIKKSQGSIEAEINLILLHSLPNSPTHNVYNAKSQLNEQLKTHKNYHFSPADKAFISLLRDQLNQQLYLFQKMINQELAQDKQTAKYRLNEKKHLDKITELELMVEQLTKKITQLKKIEQAISEHGQ
ncbi:MAG: hypothetical protein OQK09_13005 [Colwellia sp.]|nr:hypothetical protein [Colwellia sp.]MCW8864286.1 hypothetical protein [Colwellia sp.]MCW9082425.1 hypothetical protein [Colwellia sp.]